jgi:hypothetical protein
MKTTRNSKICWRALRHWAFAGVMTVALVLSGRTALASGTVVGWGGDGHGQRTPPNGLTDVVAIAAGYEHSLALRADGTVVGWGRNLNGEAAPPAGLDDVVAIEAGERHSLALRADGTVIAWGDNQYGQATPPDGLNGAIAIAAGRWHSLALRADGTVVGWGYNLIGETMPPAGLSDAVAIAAGAHHSLALRSDGAVVGWGYNFYGQATPPAGLTDAVAVAAEWLHSLALRADGTVVGWGDNLTLATLPPVGLSDVVAIEAGVYYSLALRGDGTVVGWGLNDHGQRTPPPALDNVVAIAAGRYHSLALVRTAPPNQPPTDIFLSNNAVAENEPVGATIGTFTAVDADAEGSHTFELVNGHGSQDNDSFSLQGNSLKTAVSFNYLIKNVYRIRVQTADAGGLAFQKAFTILVLEGSGLAVIDQEQPEIDLEAEWLLITDQQEVAQTVTAGISGFLTEVRFPVGLGLDAGASKGQHQSPLVIEIQGVSEEGQPNGVVRGWASFEELPDCLDLHDDEVIILWCWRRFVFPEPVRFSAGEQFAIVLRAFVSPFVDARSYTIPPGPMNVDSYPGGNGYVRSSSAGEWGCLCDGSGFDLPFQTFVLPDDADNTPSGENIVVSQTASDGASVTLGFTQVDVAGQTTVTAVSPGQNQHPPQGFKFGNPPVLYEVETTAQFSDSVQICFTWTEGMFSNESNLKLFHSPDGQSGWNDITTFLDTESNTICGSVNAFSYFGLFEAVEPIHVTILNPPSGFLERINSPILFSGAFTEGGSGSGYQANWTFESAALLPASLPGTIAGASVEDALQFATPGVYHFTLTVTDDDGNSGIASTIDDDLPAYVVIYDPEGGFVTGGGWIWSPPGAFHPDLEDYADVQGRASFGFVSRYQRGATVPAGNTEFQFRAGNLGFKSSHYQWLVVAGARAQFKGWGSINGQGEYGFMLTAIDGQVSGGGGHDRFRIKIWDEESGVIIYDNQTGTDDNADLDDATILRGGSIVIHTPPSGGKK